MRTVSYQTIVPREQVQVAPHTSKFQSLRVGLVGILITLAAGCGQTPGPPMEEKTVLQHRLWGSWMLAKGTPASSCEVDQVRRPALGCRKSVEFFSGRMHSPEKGVLHVKAKRPEGLTGFGLIETQVKVPDLSAWLPMEPFTIAPEEDLISQQIRLKKIRDKTHRAILNVRPLLSSRSDWWIRAIKPQPSTLLKFDLAILPEAISAGAQSARVRVFAKVKSEPRKLIFEKIVKPQQPASWQPQTVALGSFAGQSTALTFVTEPWPPGPESFSAPLIGAPMLTYRTPAPSSRQNVILISLDTLRGDYVGAKRLGRPLTPNLDAFAEQGALFEQAMTTFPSTTASHMSLMTGLYPATHNTSHPGISVSGEIPLMAEILAKLGFATAAVTENAMLAASSGFSRGFDFYREIRDLGLNVAQGQIEKTFQSGVAWLEKHKDERFFLFLHTYQVHGPYDPPPEYDVFPSNFEGTKSGSLVRRSISQSNAYAGEVLYTDAIVGELLQKISDLGLDENTIVIITSDHGEEFGLHGHIGHSQTPFESVMRVPLLIRAPGKIEPGTKVRRVVSLVDILPTLLALLDPDAPANSFNPPAYQGISLLDMMQDTSLPARHAVFAESRRPGHQSIVARTDTHRFIISKDGSEEQRIFDLRVDATEQHNLQSPALQKEGHRLAQNYRKLRPKNAEKGKNMQQVQTIDAETAAKLRALGYTD